MLNHSKDFALVKDCGCLRKKPLIDWVGIDQFQLRNFIQQKVVKERYELFCSFYIASPYTPAVVFHSFMP
jgi:hypothetical protein